MYAEVLIEYGVKSLDKSFTYIIPDSLKDNLKVGMKVLIPFGNKIINGFVTNIKDSYIEDYELKEIVDIVDRELVLNKESFLLKNNIALWDVIASCEIKGSSDSSITNVIPNDIESLVRKINIKYIFTTGDK